MKAKKAKTVALLLAVCGGAAPAMALDTHRAVEFPGAPGETYLYNSDISAPDSPSQSPQGFCSWWYKASDKKTANIIANFPITTGLVGVKITHRYEAGDNTVRTHLALFDQGRVSFAIWEGEPISYDGGWHVHHLIWNLKTSPPIAVHLVGGIDDTWTGRRSTGQPFQAGINGAQWAVGALSSVAGVSSATEYYHGKLANLFCDFQPDVFDITFPTTPLSVPGVETAVLVQRPDGTNVLAPLDLGPACAAVVTPFTATLSTICMTGGKFEFPDNWGKPFQTIGTGILDAPDSPYDVLGP